MSRAIASTFNPMELEASSTVKQESIADYVYGHPIVLESVVGKTGFASVE